MIIVSGCHMGGIGKTKYCFPLFHFSKPYYTFSKFDLPKVKLKDKNG